ncbi:uncharacterized protein METZ01_LOCUS276241 [marine metagenome]|uniref:Uncharacterized protein n=1 Tax=marine metagenome TaxID=408172 RepID=A0A382KKC7_9ZZZZ
MDKISILIIKEKNIVDDQKQYHIKNELDSLNKTLENSISRSQVKEYIEKLIEINSKLWLIEDDIRDCERKKQFDQKFIDLARAIYITNDRRAEIKLKINKKFGSKLVEVKSYEKY